MFSIVSQYTQSLNTYQLATPKQMTKNLLKIALPAIAIVGLAYASTAHAGPLAYAACVAECTALTLGGFLPLCLTGCGPLLMAPTP